MSEDRVMKETTEHCGPFEFRLEGLEDGYRVTFKGDAEKLRIQRRVGASFINFVRQADKAGWRIPWCWRWLLRFWDRYNKRPES